MEDWYAIPESQRLTHTRRWAQRRAAKSEYPGAYTNAFEHVLSVVQRKGEHGLLGRSPDWEHPVELAAEIEALAAARALKYWGTAQGLCLSRRASDKALAA